MSATQMYNIEVEFRCEPKGIHSFGIEGSDKDDAICAVMGVLCNLNADDYTILDVIEDTKFDVEAEREKIRAKKALEAKFKEAGEKFSEFVQGKTTKHYLVLENDEFVIKSEDEQIHGKIAAVYEPEEQKD